MASIIKNRAVVNDDWTVVRPAEDGALPAVDALPAGKVLVPFALWQAEREALTASRGAAEIGVWLAPDNEPAEIVADFDKIALIAVDFPVFRDGRGYSIGRLLRERYGCKGELRAIGDVLRDQFTFMFALRLRCLRRARGQGHRRRAESVRRIQLQLSGRGRQSSPLFRRRDAGELERRRHERPSVAHAGTAAKVERLDALLDSIARRHANVKLASSLAAEDMLLTHAILSRGVKIGIFSLNTGRLHAETLGMLDRVKERYGYDIEQFHPQPEAVDEYVGAHGLNAFYESVDLRKSCCGIRKVEPLNRALSDVSAWVTGQRREQSVTRVELHEEEHDARATSPSSIRWRTGPKPKCGTT